jgi:hypothetical protein
MRRTTPGESEPVLELKMSGRALRKGITPWRTVMAALDQEAADLIDQPRALAHEARAHAMQCQQVHLLWRLDRHEAQRRGFRSCAP